MPMTCTRRGAPSEGAADEEELPRTEPRDQGAEADSDRDDDDGDPSTDDRRLFGHLERGGAFQIFGDIGTFFGPVNIASAMGTVGQTDAFSLTPWFGVAYELTEALTIGGQWGFSMLGHGDVNLVAGTPTGGGVALIAGNPVLSGRWLPWGGDGGPVTWGIDLEIAFPASNVGNVAELTAMNSAIGSRGAWDLWHWASGVFSLVPGAFLRWELAEGFVLEFEGDLGLLLGVGNGRPSTIGVLQLGVDASYRFADAIGVGLRLWTVFDGEIFPGREESQVSMAPYLPLFFDPLWLRAEFILNLTSPYGTSFSDGKWWGTRLVAGVDI
ncbi:MAG: hypothetical protein DRJ42_22390 [Deltaproteobacteria bacterium]|nr:MAG: hypothetical protein DRJ42_22390 [Deltaproteobacteria bacterium]